MKLTPGSLDGKIILITGASQGLGKELSCQLAQLGATLLLIARNENLLQQLTTEIVTRGGKAEYFCCDVADSDQVIHTVSRIIEKYNHIDALVNNAGIWLSNQAAADLARIKQTFAVNSLGPIYFSQSLLPYFEQRNSGHIVFINSIAGLTYPENKNWSVYAASKWAVTGYAKSLACRYNNTSNIKITSIHPGPISTNIDKNAGDNFGDDHSTEMNVAEVADFVIAAITAPGNIQVDSVEFKTINWNL